MQRFTNRSRYALPPLAALAFCAQGALAQDAPEENDEDGVILLTPPEGTGRGDKPGPGSAPTIPDPDGRTTTVTGPRSTAPSILAIFAHPDDEITIAPILSRIAREGGEVTLVFATSGDVGPGVSGLEPGEELAELREGEARCSAFALGLDEPIFWRMGDGTLAAMARESDLAESIATIIDLEQPDLVMTWGPDGGYGHADHRMISAVVTQVVQSMGEQRPDLLYSAFPAGAEALPGFENWATTDPALVTDRLRYEILDLDAARGAIDCHQSQFDQTARTMLPDLLHRRVWNGAVFFRLAFPATGER